MSADLKIEIHLTVDEQRRIVQAEAGEPCFRIWLSREEHDLASFADFTSHPLGDGRVAVWRRQSDLDKLLTSGRMDLWRELCSRKIDDSVT